MLVEEFFWPKVVARAGVEAEEALDLFTNLDNLTLVTEVRCLEDAIRALEAALTKARLVVNQMKGTVWSSTGVRSDTEREDFVLAGCPGTCAMTSSDPVPVRIACYIERFLRKRAGVAVATHPGNHRPCASGPTSCPGSELPSHGVHSAKEHSPPPSGEVGRDEGVLQVGRRGSVQGAKRIFDLPEMLEWQNEALFRTVESGVCGSLNSADAQQGWEA